MNKTPWQPIYEALKVLTRFHPPESVVEIRAPKAGRLKTLSGYFELDQLEKAAKEAASWDRQVPSLYVTLNPVKNALLGRAANEIIKYAEYTTADADILYRTWLPIDIDPVRPAGTSSSEEEHESSLRKALQVETWMSQQGWSGSVFSDSGNGAHLLWPVQLENTSESRILVEKCLKTLDEKFSDEIVKIDTSVGNASRIFKLYGTHACKGSDTKNRPHRLASIL